MTLFVGGLYGPGQGVYRSTDLGASWTRVDSGQFPEAVVWGTTKHVYAMWGWACSGCNLGANFEIASATGDTWTPTPVPAGLIIGPNSVAVTSDGTHSIFVRRDVVRRDPGATSNPWSRGAVQALAGRLQALALAPPASPTPECCAPFHRAGSERRRRPRR